MVYTYHGKEECKNLNCCLILHYNNTYSVFGIRKYKTTNDTMVITDAALFIYFAIRRLCNTIIKAIVIDLHLSRIDKYVNMLYI